MILSMTGFGRNVYSEGKFALESEIKSLNSRFLDLSVKVPKELSQYEFDIRDLIKSKLIRGKISVTLNLTVNPNENDVISVNESALRNVISNLEKIKDHSKYSGEISLDNILLLRDFFVIDSDSELGIDWENLKASISTAVDNLIEMRSKEGLQLKNDIESRIASIEDSLIKIEVQAKNSTHEYFEKFKDKAKKLYDEFIDDENRFLLELGILSEKHDVTEECIRLRSHIKLFYETLSSAVDIGRKLNFICQEMNREVNTINSKSVSSEISHLGISIKEELEKIREQVQNIE